MNLTPEVIFCYMKVSSTITSSPDLRSSSRANTNAIEISPPSHTPLRIMSPLMEEIDLFLADDGSKTTRKLRVMKSTPEMTYFYFPSRFRIILCYYPNYDFPDCEELSICPIIKRFSLSSASIGNPIS
ncbi:hypothetical protein Tco_0954114 [Tanacetum coccineum]|uniref:Uncharacterized protein n=1 Tax=Tanacetum coccineum TaxID=301880 RepID=A0ABQ5E4E7_9ASTR